MESSRVELAARARPLEVAPHCWMVGFRDPASLLQCNTYLRHYPGPAGGQRVCVDPGSALDWPAVERNLLELSGSLEAINAFTLNHQDPDVVANSPRLCEANRRVQAIVSDDTWRLVRHLNIHPAKLELANVARNSKVFGERLRVVPTPFCHFRGALAWYDPEIRTLFSGDLFGGLNQIGRVHLFAEDDDWIGVAQFHQIYMPSREILRYAVRQIKALVPAVEIIAPQHGHVLGGDQVPAFLDRMQELLVGYDLLAAELDDRFLDGYREVIAQLLEFAAETMGPTEVHYRIKGTHVTDNLERIARYQGDDLRVFSEGYAALAKIFARLAQNEAIEFVSALRSFTLAACSARDLPLPPVGAGLEEAG